MADPWPCERPLLSVYKDLLRELQCSMLRRTARSILTPPGHLQCRLVRPGPLRARLYDIRARPGPAIATAMFHSTPRREGLPFLMAGMASVLKVRFEMTTSDHVGSTRW